MSTGLQCLQCYRKQNSRRAAVECFFDGLDRMRERVELSEMCIEQIYRFETPESPVINVLPNGFVYEKSGWAEGDLDRLLDHNLQRNLWQLEVLPESDYTPFLQAGGVGNDLLPALFGSEFEICGTEHGDVYHVTRHGIPDIPALEEWCRTQFALPVSDSAAYRELLPKVRFLAELTGGRLELVFPQMHGPFTNALRIMPEQEGLIAAHVSSECLKMLIDRIGVSVLEIMRGFRDAVGSTALCRPRARLCQASSVHGVVVDDWISVMGPEQYLALASDYYRAISDEFGGIYLHTCGPVIWHEDAFLGIPGLAGFECTFTDGARSTTADFEVLKGTFAGKLVLGAFYSAHPPSPRIVDDEENLTPEWLERMSLNGGFMLNQGGSLQKCRAFLAYMRQDAHVPA